MKIVRPLFSIQNVGSIGVELIIKPTKHTSFSMKHTRLKDQKGVILVRALENWKHIMRVKKILFKQITGSL